MPRVSKSQITQLPSLHPTDLIGQSKSEKLDKVQQLIIHKTNFLLYVYTKHSR